MPSARRLLNRLAKAKGAHDELIAKAHRAQADALEIEAMAKRRLADEYDAAQLRGEIRTQGGDQNSKAEVCSVSEIGLTHKDIHEARQIRDAGEAAMPTCRGQGLYVRNGSRLRSYTSWSSSLPQLSGGSLPAG